jgi:hypothetical protein
MEPNESKTTKEPTLWVPGWAIRIHVTIKLSDGADALQKAILGLIKAGTPGLPGSLANELCLEENIVESAMKSLADQDWIQWGDGEWVRTTSNNQSETQDERRTGWVFWDSLRQRLLPELLLDDLDHSLDKIETATQASEFLKEDEFPRPEPSQVSMELIPTVEARGFRARELRKTANSFEFLNLDLGDSIQRVTLQGLRRKMRWHPLVVPYRIEENLGAQPSVYCCEPTYSPELSLESPYSPFLRAVIEEKSAKAYAPITAHANDLQGKHRAKHSAEFLADFGSPERLDAEAKNAVRRMMSETSLQGLFASPVLMSTAEDAERIWIVTAKLPQSSKNLRTQYSSVLQALATCISDELLPMWENNISAKDLSRNYPSKYHANKSGLNFDSVKRRWDARVANFSTTHGMPFTRWGIGTAGDARSDATWPTKRTQLGTVIRSWAALAICACNDPEGRFVLRWIRESLSDFPDLFEVYEAVKDQRNTDKGRSSESISITEYRDSIYRIWKAIANGHKRATEQLGYPKP